MSRFYAPVHYRGDNFLEPEHGVCPFPQYPHIGMEGRPVLLGDANMSYRVDLVSDYTLEIIKMNEIAKSSVNAANMDVHEIKSVSSSIFTLWRNFLLTSPSIHELRRGLQTDPDQIPLLVVFDVSCKDVYRSKREVLIENPKPPPDPCP